MALPDPQRGLVISYSYLWHNEKQDGQEEGRKDRPCVIVLAAEQDDVGVMVTVVPVTHAEPTDISIAVELPAAVKKYLGLDDQPSWVILDEGNRFLWPGYDLKQIKGEKGKFHYGMLPPKLYYNLVEKFVAIWKAGQNKQVSRD